MSIIEPIKRCHVWQVATVYLLFIVIPKTKSPQVYPASFCASLVCVQRNRPHFKLISQNDEEINLVF